MCCGGAESMEEGQATIKDTVQGHTTEDKKTISKSVACRVAEVCYDRLNAEEKSNLKAVLSLNGGAVLTMNTLCSGTDDIIFNTRDRPIMMPVLGQHSF